MAAFEYKGFDTAGKNVSGIIDADSAKTARAQLKRQNIFPSEIKEQKSGQVTKGKGLSVEIDLKKIFQRVSVNELTEFTSQLETLFRTNVDIAEALQILGEQTNNEMLELALAEIRDDVRQGKPLSDAMKQHPKIFNNLYISLIEVGQESGNLDQVLSRLREYTQKIQDLQQKLISALAYPILMGGISTAVILALFIFVIPRIKETFESFGATLPLLTRFFIALSDFIVFRWYIPLFLTICAIFLFRYWVRTPMGARTFDAIKLKVPILGPLLRMIAISRFSRTLSTLLKSGVPMTTALDTAKNVVGNIVLAEAIEEAQNSIIKGQNFADPLSKSGQFPPLLVRMISIGERTGEMENMLLEASDTYDQRVSSQINA
ncbi:MAG: type II secretion system F family protein, partial [Myxococcota bacterium]|nr:type II secretion system F family protein [Myxococcota bacterium]